MRFVLLQVLSPHLIDGPLAAAMTAMASCLFKNQDVMNFRLSSVNLCILNSGLPAIGLCSCEMISCLGLSSRKDLCQIGFVRFRFNPNKYT